MEKEKRNLLFYLNHIEEIVIVAMFIAMVLIIFIQVIMRYVFNNSLVWSEELGKFLFVWISWMGISLGERVGEHIKITLLVTKLKWKAAKICNIASLLVVIVICAVTCRYGVLLVVTQATTHYAGIKISMAWGYLSVVIGCGLMLIRDVGLTVREITALVRGEKPAGEEGGA